MFLVLILTLIIGSQAYSSPYKTHYQKDELQIKLKSISSLIKSSKTKFSNHYLFIAEVEELRVAKKTAELSELLEKGKKVEILVAKSICYDEVLASFQMKTNTSLEISNLKLLTFKKVKKKKYDAFLKAEIFQSKERSNAGCALVKE